MTPEEREIWERNRGIGNEVLVRRGRRFADPIPVPSLVLFPLGCTDSPVFRVADLSDTFLFLDHSQELVETVPPTRIVQRHPYYTRGRGTTASTLLGSRPLALQQRGSQCSRGRDHRRLPTKRLAQVRVQIDGMLDPGGQIRVGDS